MFSKRGFTMIEMMLSMTFVSFLMITIALTSVSMARTYQRGVTLSEVNAAGRAIITDMQRTISQAPVVVQGQTVFQYTSNSICFSSYSYVWNSGYDIATKQPSSLIYYKGAPRPINGNNIVRLAKVYDPTNSMCSRAPTSVPAKNATELLPSDSSSGTSYNGIAIQNTGGGGSADGPTNVGITAVQLDKGDDSTTQALYQVTFIVGTNDQSSLSNGSGFATAPSCQPPANNPTGLEYCAVNRFSFLIRAGGGGTDVAG